MIRFLGGLQERDERSGISSFYELIQYLRGVTYPSLNQLTFCEEFPMYGELLPQPIEAAVMVSELC